MVEVEIEKVEQESVDWFGGIRSAIQEWIDDNDGNVVFTGSFIVLKDEIDLKKKDGLIEKSVNVALGPKNLIQADLEIFKKHIDKEKSDIINW